MCKLAVYSFVSLLPFSYFLCLPGGGPGVWVQGRFFLQLIRVTQSGRDVSSLMLRVKEMSFPTGFASAKRYFIPYPVTVALWFLLSYVRVLISICVFYATASQRNDVNFEVFISSFLSFLCFQIKVVMFNNVASKGLRVISYQVTKKLKRTNDLRILELQTNLRQKVKLHY